MSLRIGLATCAALPELDEDGPGLIEALHARGATGAPAVWDDPGVDWSDFDLVVVRCTWDYVGRRDEFLAWARRTPRLANPADVISWNTDKRYLLDLEAAGVPIVPTRLVPPGAPLELPDHPVVIKPAVGAGAVDTARFTPDQRELAVELVAHLHASGRVAMVQPYLPSVESAGETAVLVMGGRHSHTMRKAALLDGPAWAVETLYRPETMSRHDADAEHLDLARRVLEAVPGGPDRLLYARVDMLPGADGAPRLLELEITEPSMFLIYDDEAPARFADAILAAAAAARPR